MGQRHSDGYAEFGGAVSGVTVKLDLDVGPAAADLDLKWVPAVHSERLDDGLLGAEAGGQMLDRVVLSVAVISLLVCEQRGSESSVATEAFGKPIGFYEVDSDMRRRSHVANLRQP